MGGVLQADYGGGGARATGKLWGDVLQAYYRQTMGGGARATGKLWGGARATGKLWGGGTCYRQTMGGCTLEASYRGSP